MDQRSDNRRQAAPGIGKIGGTLRFTDRVIQCDCCVGALGEQVSGQK